MHISCSAPKRACLRMHIYICVFWKKFIYIYIYIHTYVAFFGAWFQAVVARSPMDMEATKCDQDWVHLCRVHLDSHTVYIYICIYTDRQTGRQAGKQTDIHVHICLYTHTIFGVKYPQGRSGPHSNPAHQQIHGCFSRGGCIYTYSIYIYTSIYVFFKIWRVNMNAKSQTMTSSSCLYLLYSCRIHQQIHQQNSWKPKARQPTRATKQPRTIGGIYRKGDGSFTFCAYSRTQSATF